MKPKSVCIKKFRKYLFTAIKGNQMRKKLLQRHRKFSCQFEKGVYICLEHFQTISLSRKAHTIQRIKYLLFS